MGRPEHQKVTQISANPSKRVRFVNLDFSTAIGAGAAVDVQLLAPPGYISTVKNLRIKWTGFVGATSGSLVIQLFVASIIGVTMGEAKYDSHLEYLWRCWNGLTLLNQFPNDIAAQASITEGALVFDEFNALKVTFTNLTNLSDGGAIKNCQFWLVDEKVT